MQSYGSGNVDCGNTSNSNNTNITVNRVDDEDSRIKQWLSPLDSARRHQNVQTSRVKGVGTWLLRRREFREWSVSRRVPVLPVLFCYGDPGVGKTHIRSVGKIS